MKNTLLNSKNINLEKAIQKNKYSKVQVCSNCLMDSEIIDITFDDFGCCNLCNSAKKKLAKVTFTTEQETANLEYWSKKIKNDKRGTYDSLIGVSGGVDSSYIVYLAKKMELTPLIVHFDNGWNSEIAVSNIKKIVDKTGHDLKTYVINWDEFRDLQRSFLLAGVIDIEMLTDHAIGAAMMKIRKDFGIKYILRGNNVVTEYGMPASWIWNKRDSRNIKNIHKKFGRVKLKTFPFMNTLRWELMRVLGVNGTNVELLNQINFNKSSAMTTLKREFNWEYYGGKHYESIFTKFYQAYILPQKFNVDKRKAHLSALIRAGELSKNEANVLIAEPLYNTLELENDRDFVIKKLGFTSDEFEKIMSEKPVKHDHYKTEKQLVKFLQFLAKNFIRKV